MKKAIPLLAAIGLIVSILTFSVNAASNTTWTTIASGACGKNNTTLATWKLQSATHPQIINNVQDYERLIISGTGEMEDYYQTSNGSTNAPWQEMAWDTNSIVIEEGLTHIGNNAFLCASYSTCYVSLPNSLQSIGSYAFCGAMTYVNELIIPENVTYIGEYAFYNNHFTNLEIIGNVSILQEGVFGYCQSLTTVTIPKSVTSIADYAFDYCTSLTDVYYEGTIAEWEEINIGSGNNYLLNATVHFPTINVESVSLDKTSKTMFTGSTYTLTATVLPENADNQTVSWKSSDSTIATVDNGVITAISPGTAIITVTTADGNKTASCTVSVQASNVAVSSVSLNKSELVIQVGDTETLIATVFPNNATNKNVTWSTSNANVITVVNGKLTPKAEGAATITATTVDGGMTATCNVIVQGADVPVISITLNKSTLRLWTGNEETLEATISPSDASNKKVSWASSNTSVATVDENGKITAKSKGQTTITVTTDDGSKIASCVVDVHYGATVNEFRIWKTNYGTQYLTSEEVYYKNHILDVSWSPVISRTANTDDYDMFSILNFNIVSDTGETYATGCQPYWSIYNSVDQKLKYYVPAGNTYTITAILRLGYWENGYFVEKASYQSNTITINLSDCTYYKTSFEDEYLANAATCGSPAKYYANCQYCGVNYDKLFSRGAINPDNHVYGNWTSVDETHHSRSCECGSSMETGTHSYVNSICEYCGTDQPGMDTTVPVDSISLNMNKLNLIIGATETLIAQISPSDATNKSMTWTSSNTSVATVSNGIVTAVGAGTTTITATTEDGGFTDTCTVTVEAPEADPDAPTITASTVRNYAGRTVDVTIDIANNPGIAFIRLKVGYDIDALTLIGVTDANLISGATHSNNLSANPYTLYWNNPTITENITANGTAVTLTFEIAENAEIGTYPITVSYDYGNSDIIDKDFNKLIFAIVNGAVNVTDVISGDTDGDGVVTPVDNAHIARYVAGWNGYDDSVIDMTAADVNCDGKVNNIDVAILARHLASWIGYETLPYSG